MTVLVTVIYRTTSCFFVTQQVQRLNTFHCGVIDKSLERLPDYPRTAGRFICTTFVLQSISC